MPDKMRRKLNNDGGRVFLPDNTKLYYQFSRMFGITYVNEVNFYALSRYSDIEPLNAQELLDLAHRVIEAYMTIGITPTKLTSPVSVYNEILQTLDFPRAYELPDSAIPMLDVASRICAREWRQVYTLGHWGKDEIFDYDLSAAYPGLMANLPDIRNAKFFESDTLPEVYSWGILSGDIKVIHDVSPFQTNYRGAECYPKGIIKDELITTDQLWLLKKYGGDFKMKHGWFFTLPKTYSFPFRQTMNELYQSREHPNPLVSKIAKGISVGIGGRLMHRHDDGGLGNEFNSIYALMNTSRCSTKVANFIYRNFEDSHVVSIMVDGVLATKKVDLPNIKQMGKWRLNEPSPTLVLNIFAQWMADKRPSNITYTELMELINQRPNASVYGEVDFNLQNYNRYFNILPKTGKELISNKYNSKPFES